MKIAKKRNCQKGRPCGFTCIDPDEICRKELGQNISEGLGKVSEEVSSRDSLQENFLKILEKNSFSLPNRSFSSKDVANAVIQASNQLEGEAKENLRKMMSFVEKDKQNLVISTTHSYHNQVTDSSWVNSPEFKELTARAYAKGNPSDTVNKLRLDVENLDMNIERLLKKIEVFEKNGQDTKVVVANLLEARKERRIKLEELRYPDFAIAKKVLARDGVRGFTNSNSRNIILIDNPKGYGGFNKGRATDATLISKQIQDTMERRANWASLTPEQQSATFNIVGSLGKDKFNERLLATYVHEMGHQIHYRSGIEDPPPKSTTLGRALGRGISGYSNESYRETFAEAFVAFVFNPKALKQQDEPLYNWVRDNLDYALSNAGSSKLIPSFF